MTAAVHSDMLDSASGLNPDSWWSVLTSSELEADHSFGRLLQIYCHCQNRLATIVEMQKCRLFLVNGANHCQTATYSVSCSLCCFRLYLLSSCNEELIRCRTFTNQTATSVPTLIVIHPLWNISVLFLLSGSHFTTVMSHYSCCSLVNVITSLLLIIRNN